MAADGSTAVYPIALDEFSEATGRKFTAPMGFCVYFHLPSKFVRKDCCRHLKRGWGNRDRCTRLCFARTRRIWDDANGADLAKHWHASAERTMATICTCYDPQESRRPQRDAAVRVLFGYVRCEKPDAATRIASHQLLKPLHRANLDRAKKAALHW